MNSPKNVLSVFQLMILMFIYDTIGVLDIIDFNKIIQAI